MPSTPRAGLAGSRASWEEECEEGEEEWEDASFLGSSPTGGGSRGAGGTRVLGLTGVAGLLGSVRFGSACALWLV